MDRINNRVSNSWIKAIAAIIFRVIVIIMGYSRMEVKAIIIYSSSNN